MQSCVYCTIIQSSQFIELAKVPVNKGSLIKISYKGTKEVSKNIAYIQIDNYSVIEK